MINLRILKRDYGDQSRQLTVQQTKQAIAELKGAWAIFAQDTKIPNEEVYHRINSNDIQDGMNLQVVPQLAGG